MALVCLLFVLAAIASLFGMLLTATPGEEKAGIALFIISCILMFATVIAGGLIGVN